MQWHASSRVHGVPSACVQHEVNVGSCSTCLLALLLCRAYSLSYLAHPIRRQVHVPHRAHEAHDLQPIPAAPCHDPRTRRGDCWSSSHVSRSHFSATAPAATRPMVSRADDLHRGQGEGRHAQHWHGGPSVLHADRAPTALDPLAHPLSLPCRAACHPRWQRACRT